MNESEIRRRLQSVDSRIAVHTSAARQLESERAQLLARLCDAGGCSDSRPMASIAKQ
jgi:hypothetical protein